MQDVDVNAAHKGKGHLGAGFWLRESPHLATLLLTVGGVAYVSTTDRPLLYYWDFVAVFIAAVCIFVGWKRADGGKSKRRLIWTQILHWAAFLLAMNLVFLPSVQADVDIDGTGLVLLMLLALGTFVAGVHIPSWRMAANGVIMALSVPAIAWIDQSALLLTLVALVIAAIALAVVRHRSKA
ncbi:hypothetical protein [Acuticoccus kandeliae]|uniref:hypothetical protein n=1 Tax=Acuticoccus kandeliae TaxID=2073160 RepID=UPI000D3E44C9|nr:hypothetical protein [Acuticoccus kandeliae]